MDTAAVIKVGDGRGFIIEAGNNRLVVTAGHCLPELPRAVSFLSDWENTYMRLMGPLGAAETPVCAHCAFVDPVADIAVLEQPDNQSMPDEADAYDELVEAAEPFTVANAGYETAGRLLSLDGDWFDCRVWHQGSGMQLTEIAQRTAGGMSGSPIVDSGGHAIGVYSCGGNTPQGPEAHLAAHLPGWVIARLGLRLPEELKPGSDGHRRWLERFAVSAGRR